MQVRCTGFFQSGWWGLSADREPRGLEEGCTASTVNVRNEWRASTENEIWYSAPQASLFDLQHNPLFKLSRRLRLFCHHMTLQKHFHVEGLWEPASVSSRPTHCSITVKLSGYTSGLQWSHSQRLFAIVRMHNFSALRKLTCIAVQIDYVNLHEALCWNYPKKATRGQRTEHLERSRNLCMFRCMSCKWKSPWQ